MAKRKKYGLTTVAMEAALAAKRATIAWEKFTASMKEPAKPAPVDPEVQRQVLAARWNVPVSCVRLTGEKGA